MQNKLNGKERRSKPNSASATDHIMHQTCKEEFSDWPNGLLSIGTLGNSALKLPENSNLQQSLSSCQDQPKDNLKSEKHIDCLPSLEHNKTSDKSINGDSENKDSNLQQSISVVPSRESDIRLHNTANSIGKKSLSFLFKKAFLCGGGFSSAPFLRDPFPEPKLDKSKMEKILGDILQKKIYPQSSTQMTTAKKYLYMPESESEGSKWVKTDSEYIVLEI
ncbi:Hypothetical predicted protein [Olea europaea subsp. europaea]|uniref:Uncharacterized protein n=1 Tax=Olea europaea subsp. europaea TaxID=158383 RepID=A0A8S0U2Z9_OLEEU|nr:Hypothetical predicted protein [Olea europaea subsp. europaea]